MDNPEQEPIELPAPQVQLGEPSLPATEPFAWQPAVRVFPPWSGFDVLAVAGFTVAAVFLGSMLALGVAHVATAGRHVPITELATNTVVLIGGQMAAYPAVILFMMSLVRNRSHERFWRAIQWKWQGVTGLRFLAYGVAFALAVEYASQYLPIPKSLPVDKYFNETAGAYLMAAFGISLAPLLEELFFRGMLYPVMRRAVGVTPAVLFTATTFAFIHGAQLGYAWAPLLSIFVVGVVFTLVREHTGSVAASFLMHCGYNFALFAMLWIDSDHFLHLEKAMS